MTARFRRAFVPSGSCQPDRGYFVFGVEVSESRNCSTSWATMAAERGFCRSCPAWIVTRRASGMRAANSLLFAGGTALSWSPQTTRVGASMQPRTGMLDQVEMARAARASPTDAVAATVFRDSASARFG